jgi:hypothetical protein
MNAEPEELEFPKHLILERYGRLGNGPESTVNHPYFVGAFRNVTRVWVRHWQNGHSGIRRRFDANAGVHRLLKLPL